MRRFPGFKHLVLTVLAVVLPFAGMSGAPAERPNVVFILCDDLNDYVGYLGGHPQARTPHLDSLSASGTSFPRAYSNNPICAPSRASLLTGIYPQNSRNLFFDPWYGNSVLANSRTLMEHFAENGYHVAGTGKLMHHFKAENWQEFGQAANMGPFAWDGLQAVAHPSVPEPFRSVDPVDGSLAPLSDVPFGGQPGQGWSHNPNSYVPFHYINEDDRDRMPDETYAHWASARIARHAADKALNPDAPPLFLAVGFIRPHTPLYAPRKYFDLFPLESLELPELLQDDALDTHYRDIIPGNAKGLRYYRALAEAYGSDTLGLKAFVQAYLACTAFLDDQIGVVLAALESNGLADNTIVVVTSDHGWVMGEKEYLFKDAPWEESTQVPLIIRAPGVSQPGSLAGVPVSLIDLYPTLVDLCGLPDETRKTGTGRPLDGHSLVPLLQDPASRDWGGPDVAFTLIHAVNHPASPVPEWGDNDPAYHHYSLRSENFRYIRYNDGEEELYDHRVDPHEWQNVAALPENVDSLGFFRSRLADFLPQEPWLDPADIISINLVDDPDGPDAIAGLQAFGLAGLGTVTGNWNNLNASTDGLVRGSGAASPASLQLSQPPALTVSNLSATFPHGYWAVVYHAASAGSGVVRNAGHTVIGGPENPLFEDVFSPPLYLSPELQGLPAGLQLVAAHARTRLWAGFPITRTGYVDTGRGFLGWLWVGSGGTGISNWLYSVSLGQWVYLRENYLSPGSGSWLYLLNAAGFHPGPLQQGWFFSEALQSWVLSYAEQTTSGPGWAYVLDLAD